jgi:hypothetical protein
MEFVPFWLSAAGMGVGAFLGARGLFDPHWAARLVRLREDGPGGFAEFRGTFGGLFLASQLAGLAFMVPTALEMETLAGTPTHWTAMGAAAVCGAMWIGTGFARILSMIVDGTATPMNRIATGFEFVVGALVLAPWFL